ncbi:phage tail tube assembly chaperone [Limosilactobacillus vaginalis]|uniref:phage tail tube assembly chaperone n=1 Tax=Limosilactobacillus vaginalis TaxID=1633 RepID=UPI0022E30579|nr:phage tail tube assembly chaperone [Limosilactobacillus vaginalis]
MVVKIRTTQIGLKKPINVKATLSNVDKADEMMISLLSLDVDLEEEGQDDSGTEEKDQTKVAIENLKKERAFNKKTVSFLQDILKLTDKQIQTVKETVDYNTLGEYLNYVCGRIKGISEEAFKDVDKNSPKEQSVNSEEK